MSPSRMRLRYCMALSVAFHVGLIAIPVSPAVRSLDTEAVLFVMESSATAAEEVEPRPEEREPERPAEPVATTLARRVTREEKVEPERTETAPSPEAPEALPEPEPRDMAASVTLEKPPVSAREATPILEPDVAALPPVGAASPDMPDAPVRVSFGSGWGPRFLKKVMPAYPTRARRLRKEGEVLLKLTIDQNGELLDVEVVEGAGFGFDEEAVAAAKRSTYRPAVANGRPIACEALFPIRFELR